MYAGRLVEVGDVAGMISQPRHPYTAGLIAAVPRLGGRGELASIPGAPPAPGNWPDGCRFGPRCPQRAARCTAEEPVLRTSTRTGVACHFPIMGGLAP
jgi:oligopeptide/dipeptide ABC transporter ATP-binding protein